MKACFFNKASGKTVKYNMLSLGGKNEDSKKEKPNTRKVSGK